MRYRIFCIICLFIHCGDSIYKPPKYAAMTMFYILNTYLPEQRAKEQCAHPNAIGYSYIGNDGKTVACLSNRVSQGLIFDSDTNLEITMETLAPGQSFLCRCPGSTGGQWQRGIKIEENPPPGVSISFIQYTKDTLALQYNTNYKQPDNLYCISLCTGTDLNKTQYQFLKIR